MTVEYVLDLANQETKGYPYYWELSDIILDHVKKGHKTFVFDSINGGPVPPQSKELLREKIQRVKKQAVEHFLPQILQEHAELKNLDKDFVVQYILDVVDNDKVFCTCEFINTGKPEYIPVIKSIINTIQTKYEIYLTGDYSGATGIAQPYEGYYVHSPKPLTK